ncbi:MAG: hypothetical protein KAH68_01525 [Draconibacterium sp.]|nr:hypothetical protein [Draconibacterium sp.]
MKRFTIFCLFFICISLFGNISYSQNLPKPSADQYKWHEQERIMFLYFAPTTWSDIEQNNHSVSTNRINPKKLDTDQCSEAAFALGAKQIIFVAKHTGGFCW